MTLVVAAACRQATKKNSGGNYGRGFCLVHDGVAVNLSGVFRGVGATEVIATGRSATASDGRHQVMGIVGDSSGN